jgi:hypothetical protein
MVHGAAGGARALSCRIANFRRLQACDGREITANGKNLPIGRDGQTTPPITRLHFMANTNHLGEISKLQKPVPEWWSHAISLKHSRICVKRRQSCTVAFDWVASEIAQS